MLRTPLARVLAAAVIASLVTLACNPDADSDLDRRRRNAAVQDDDGGGVTSPGIHDDPLLEPEPDPEPTLDAGTTNDCPRARVTSGTLKIRPTADTTQTPIGTLMMDDVVKVKDKVTGETVSGNTDWFKIETNAMTGFISAYYAECTTDPATVP